ncbi:hypothetical protein ACFE04_003859 [Oxalis oulophora]
MNTLTQFFSFLILSLATTISASNHYQLRPRLDQLQSDNELNCVSWRWAIEVDNIRNWNVVPIECESYIGHYMLGKQYRKDCDTVGLEAYKYAKSVTLKGDGKDVWVFDIDETTLSNLPYYADPSNGFGALPFNQTTFNTWVASGKALAMPGTYALYNQLLKLKYTIVLLTGRDENSRAITVSNLKNVGYHSWDKLILKGPMDHGKTAQEYKSEKRTKLVKAGYRIIGNMGDQWSDILGPNQGARTFKGEEGLLPGGPEPSALNKTKSPPMIASRGFLARSDEGGLLLACWAQGLQSAASPVVVS